MAGAACATTARNECSYHINRGRDDAERLAWEVFQSQAWRLRPSGMGGVVSVDLDIALRKLMRAGVDDALAEDLLGACEQGLLAALNEKESDDDDQGNRDPAFGQG